MKDYPYTVEEIADFLREHSWNIVGTWSDEILHSHIRWFDAIDGLGRVYKDGKLAGVAFARLVDDPETVKYAPDLHYSKDGCCVFVDLTTAIDREAFRALIWVMIKRFGKRLMIAFHRKKYEERVSVHNWQQFIMKAS